MEGEGKGEGEGKVEEGEEGKEEGRGDSKRGLTFTGKVGRQAFTGKR